MTLFISYSFLQVQKYFNESYPFLTEASIQFHHTKNKGEA
jgi:hypothetical protein